jgi:hypothetical protein
VLAQKTNVNHAHRRGFCLLYIINQTYHFFGSALQLVIRVFFYSNRAQILIRNVQGGQDCNVQGVFTAGDVSRLFNLVTDKPDDICHMFIPRIAYD